jgi:hypothetical protein
MTREEVLASDIRREMEYAMIALGHNAPWWQRAAAAFKAIHEGGGAVVNRHELELLKIAYGLSLPDLTEPQK